jgi:hypothetical protein
LYRHHIFINITAESTDSVYALTLLCCVTGVGGVSIYAGSPGRHIFKDSAHPVNVAAGSSFLEDWHQCVKTLTVSSKENQAHHLVDGETGYWQSSGTQGKVCVVEAHFVCQCVAVSINCTLQTKV